MRLGALCALRRAGAVMALKQVKDKVPAAVAGSARGDGDEVAADGGGASLRIRRVGVCARGAHQVLGHRGDDAPGSGNRPKFSIQSHC
jgi:hypothetical protein